MMPFQILAISGLAVVSILTIRSISRKRISPSAGVFWLTLWISGAIAIGWPAITVNVARRLGIARGADLVSYLSILAMLIGFFWMNLRLRRMESQITTVVRELALRDARPDSAVDSHS